ncbi:hypothetical protein [Streptomyces sp. NPDC006879]|uniref:hypothetical protein n=1 Tax=Streptomyces sp. NPDC006879 TaxID=3364767 RepID=UPI00368E67CA
MSSVQQIATALTALVNGSMVLLGKGCTCAGHGLRLAWDAAALDTEATAKAQKQADRAAQRKEAARRKRRSKKADPDDDLDEDDEHQDVDLHDITAPAVDPIHRPAWEALGILGFGAALAVGALSAAVRLFGPAASQWWAAAESYRPLIVTGGGLAWMVAAWMVAPPAPANDEDEFVSEDQEDDEDLVDADDDMEDQDLEDDVAADDGLSPGQRLQRHVLDLLATVETEYSGKGGLHVVKLLESAEQSGVLSPGSMTKKQLRDWLEASNFPVAKSCRQPRDIPSPATSDVDYGVKISELRDVLGRDVAEVYRDLYETPVVAAPAAPTEAPLPTPAQTPPAAPVPAPAGPVPGGAPAARLRLVKPLSPDRSQESAQGTA